MLIPGFVMYCRLTLVPFVVFVDPTYRERPDAVARSLELTRHCWLRLTLLIILLSIGDAIFELGPSLLKIDDLFSRFIFELQRVSIPRFALLLMCLVFENLRAVPGDK